MAKSTEAIVIEDDEEDDEEDDVVLNNTQLPKDPMECPICLQTCIHPAKLPCGHIFCFLCVKGVAYKNRRCAMCRREIPPEFLDHPQLVHGIQDLCKTKSTDDGYQWFYEGRNGWWQYDERTSQDIEEAYKKGEKSCTILVAGYVYVVDFEAMLQQRQNDPSRRRHVKRDLASIPKKGVAGLRIEGNTVAAESESESHNVTTTSPFHRQNTSNFISTIAATDAAIRIASDIIDSTLAHADDTGHSDDREQSSSQSNREQRELLDEAEELLDASQGTSIISIDHSDLFSLTLDDFRSLTLRNVIDSSDSEDDNEQIIL